jgi:hypothetical protein
LIASNWFQAVSGTWTTSSGGAPLHQGEQEGGQHYKERGVRDLPTLTKIVAGLRSQVRQKIKMLDKK